MMFKQIVFVAIFAVVAVSAKKPCCGPKQSMAGAVVTAGQVDPATGPEGFFVYEYGAFDFTNRMFGFNMTVTYPNGTGSTLRFIQKYGQGYQYIILDEFKYCQKQVVQQPEPSNCIPDNATFTSSVFMGGIKGLYEDSWTYNYVYPKDPFEGVIVMNVFQDDCSTAGTSFIGNRYNGATPIPLISSARIFNLTIGIPHPDKWFTVPSFCPSETNTVKTRGERSVPSLPNLDYFYLPHLY